MINNELATSLKAKNAIEEVIAESGYPLSGRGIYRNGPPNTGALRVNVRDQLYYWNSGPGGVAESGDVFTWLEKRNGWDFKESARFLAKRCRMPEPVFAHENAEVRQEIRKKEDTFEVAAAIFSKWLWADPDALGYARSRGWSDETIKAARLGFSGKHSKNLKLELANELRDELKNNGADFEGPAATALLGYVGNVKSWATTHNCQVDEAWIKNSRIPSFVGNDALIYPHIENGKAVYFTERFLNPKEGFRKSNNPPVALVGPKRPWYSPDWKSSSINARVICEGQADAITICFEWGIPCKALCQVAADVDPYGNPKNAVLYLGLDSDKAGAKNSFKVADTLGPMTRLFEWKTGKFPTFSNAKGETEEVKDANNLLLAMNQAEESKEFQKEFAANLLRQAKTYVEATAETAGGLRGAEKEEWQKKTVTLMLRMDEQDLSLKREGLAKSMGISVRGMGDLLKTTVKKERKASTVDEPEGTLGGWINNYLVEYIYNPETQIPSLAWREPDGTIKSGDKLMIEGKWYCAKEENYVKQGAVLFPSGLGELRPTRELAVIIEGFIKEVYLFPDNLIPRIIAYYVLLTWQFESFYALPYLRALGAAGSGKSEMMKRIGLICYRRIIANGMDTSALLFRVIDRYHGTVYLDEMDLVKSDAASDNIKLLNLGAMKDNKVSRLREVNDETNGRDFDPNAYDVFGPKLIAARKDFFDDAVGTRCITFKLQERETQEILDAGISLNLTPEIEAKAAVIRNMLLRWKLQHLKRYKEVKNEYIDPHISARLNQVTGPLMAIAEDDKALQDEIRDFLREYFKDLTLSRSMTITARVVEAFWKTRKYPDLFAQMWVTEKETGEEKILVGHITQIANQIIDEMNMSDDDQGETHKKKKDELHPHKIGRVLRDELQLRISERTNKGFFVYWDEKKMINYARKFGVNTEEIGKADPVQPRLVTESAVKVQEVIDGDLTAKQETIL